MSTQVEFKHISKSYGEFSAINNLNLKIASGALHFLLGPSGCGKTTALRILAGLEVPTSGKIFFDGEDVTTRPAAERGIGMVFQNYALWPHMTVKENVEYGLKIKKVRGPQLAERLAKALDLTHLTSFADRYPGQLSGGQQQRVALARALAIRPKVLLLDEPLSNLDAKLRNEMRRNISQIHKQTGITTIYVTHDQKEALSMGTAISIMHAGNLLQTDSPRNLYSNPGTPFVAGFIGETNLVSGTYRGKDGRGHVVDTAFGSVIAERSAKGFGDGAAVTLSIRPEVIHIRQAGASGNQDSFKFKIDHQTYLGEMEHWELSSASSHQTLKASLHQSDVDLNEGQDVDIYVNPCDVLVLDPQERLGSAT